MRRRSARSSLRGPMSSSVIRRDSRADSVVRPRAARLPGLARRRVRELRLVLVRRLRRRLCQRRLRTSRSGR